jgi:hypothetical protein
MRQIKHPDTIQKNMMAVLIDCNNCGHCIDLSTPSPADTPGLTAARNKIKGQLATWLSAVSTEEQEVHLGKPSAFLE